MAAESETHTTERRRAPRVSMDIPVEVAALECDDAARVRARAAGPATLLNLGPDGAYLTFDGAHGLQVGALVELRFAIDSLPLPLVLQAVVRWIRERTSAPGEPPPGVGVQFRGVVEYERSALADYCQRRLEERRPGG